VCVVAAAAGVVGFGQRPAAESDLKIPVGELRSQTAELRMLDRDLAAGLSGTFVQAHAGQLARAIARSRGELSSMKTETRLEEAKGEALRRSAPLVQASAALKDRRRLWAKRRTRSSPKWRRVAGTRRTAQAMNCARPRAPSR
jgi:hypothetical protein